MGFFFNTNSITPTKGSGGGGDEPYTYNFEKVGNPSVSGCFACNFSSSDYLKSQELTVTGSPQKIHLYTRIYMASMGESYILLLSNSNNQGVGGIGTNPEYSGTGYWKWRVSNTKIDSGNYSAGAWYNIHIIQEGGNYEIYINDTLLKSGTGVIWNTNEAIKVFIGSNGVASATFNTIDLSQTYIAFDDTIIWKAAE